MALIRQELGCSIVSVMFIRMIISNMPSISGKELSAISMNSLPKYSHRYIIICTTRNYGALIRTRCVFIITSHVWGLIYLPAARGIRYHTILHLFRIYMPHGVVTKKI